MSKKYFITFGNRLFEKQVGRLREEAQATGWFDDVIIDTPATIQAFYSRHKQFIDANERGYGYWIWKPYIILRQLRDMDNGDYLFYTDAGASILPHRKSRFDEYIDILERSDRPVIAFYIPDYKERDFQKPASLQRFGIDSASPILDTGQIESGVVICRKSDYTVQFFEHWLQYMLENRYELAHDFDKESYRHDQSVLSLLCKTQLPSSQIIFGVDVYGMGPFFSSRMVDAGQRLKGPDLYRMQIGYNAYDSKHSTYDAWLMDRQYAHYFTVPNLGFFTGKYDHNTGTLVANLIESKPKTNFNSDTADAKRLSELAESHYNETPQPNKVTDSRVPIPVIGTAVVNSTKWLRRLIASVDYPVSDFVIINNNGRGELAVDLEAISRSAHPYIERIHVVTLPSNLGTSGAWNLIIKSFINAPYWIIVNDDVAFCEGLLEEFKESADTNINAGIIHAYEGDPNMGSWDLFLIRDSIVARYGLFDENLYPAYSEDIDYLMRFQHDDIGRIMNLNHNYFHGEGLKGEYYIHGSQTSKTDSEIGERLKPIREKNAQYIREKWGSRSAELLPHEQAFNRYPVNQWAYDLDFVRKKYLGF